MREAQLQQVGPIQWDNAPVAVAPGPVAISHRIGPSTYGDSPLMPILSGQETHQSFGALGSQRLVSDNGASIGASFHNTDPSLNGASFGAPLRREVDRTPRVINRDGAMYDPSLHGASFGVSLRREVDRTPRVINRSVGDSYAEHSYSANLEPNFHSQFAPPPLMFDPPLEFLDARNFSAPSEFLPVCAWVPCDVLPHKAATVHDNWSGSNFCEEVAEMMRNAGGQYFSAGVSEPKMKLPTQTNTPSIGRSETGVAGIGVALERNDVTGIVKVRRITPDGSAAADGRIRVDDTILAVDGINTAVLGNELTNLIIGPVGTFVEIVVEHSSGARETLIIRRGFVQKSEVFQQPNHSHQEKSVNLSQHEKQEVQEEVASRIAEMRRRIIRTPQVSSAVLTDDLLDHRKMNGLHGNFEHYGVMENAHRFEG